MFSMKDKIESENFEGIGNHVFLINSAFSLICLIYLFAFAFYKSAPQPSEDLSYELETLEFVF